MTKEENIATLNEHLDHWKRLLSEKICDQSEGEKTIDALQNAIKALEQEPKIGHCKNCKYFEYDSVAEVHGIPLIVAHEICKRWSGGCKTSEDGYCFLFEPQEGSDGE